MVFMLENGKVIEQGSHKELMALSGKYCEMFTRQAQNYLADESYGTGKSDDISESSQEKNSRTLASHEACENCGKEAAV